LTVLQLERILLIVVVFSAAQQVQHYVGNCACLPAIAGLQLVITDASWPLRGAFLETLSRCLDNLQCRAPWYPGSAGRIAAFKQRFPGAQALGVAVPAKGQAQGAIPVEPWQLVTGGCGAWVAQFHKY
jgi:hypothetical protein